MAAIQLVSLVVLNTNGAQFSKWLPFVHGEIRIKIVPPDPVIMLYKNIVFLLFLPHFYRALRQHNLSIQSSLREVHTSNQLSIAKITNFHFDAFESNSIVFAFVDIHTDAIREEKQNSQSY